MERNIFLTGMEGITATTGRVFKQSHLGFLYDKLYHISNYAFEKILDNYVNETHPPSNIVAYFNERWITDYSIKPDTDSIPAWSQYSHKALVLYFKCINEAVRIWIGTSEEYKIWSDWFNEKIENLNKEQLESFLIEHYNNLQKQESIRKEQAKKEILEGGFKC